jgi:hypothetical protein
MKKAGRPAFLISKNNLYMYRILGLILFICSTACNTDKEYYDVRTDVRFGNHFYSIYIKNNGEALVIKGTCTNHTMPLKIYHSDTSQNFRISSVKLFYDRLRQFEAKPIIYENISGDGSMAEIWFHNKRIYYKNNFGADFWNLIDPIKQDIPKGYNPFLLDADNLFTK